MKMLIFAVLFSFNLGATTLTQYMSQPEGTSSLSFNLKNFTSEKRSNFFDTKKDLSLGTYKPVTKQNFKNEQERLTSVLSIIKTVDLELKKKKSEFNALSSQTPHKTFLILNDYKISQDSKLYPEVKSIFDKLQAMEWKQDSGIRLTNDLKEIIKITNGKEVSKTSFDFSFHCQKVSPPTVCAFKDLGILYVPK